MNRETPKRNLKKIVAKNGFGMKVEEEGDLVWNGTAYVHPITGKEIKLPNYQRFLTEKKVQHIMERMLTFGGYDPSKPVDLNMKRELIDGNNRRKSATRLMLSGQLDIPTIPYRLLSFPSKEDEHRYHRYVNDDKATSFKGDENLAFSAKRGEPYASLLFTLMDDPKCAIYGQVTPLGRRKQAHEITMKQACTILNMALNIVSAYTMDRHPNGDKAATKYIKIIKDPDEDGIDHQIVDADDCENGYNIILKRVDLLWFFMVNVLGQKNIKRNQTNNPNAKYYNSKMFHNFLRLFCLLYTQYYFGKTFIKEDKLKQVISRIKDKVSFEKVLPLDKENQLTMMVNGFNASRSKNLLILERGKDKQVIMLWHE